MRKTGTALGVSKQAIIYWFPSKADLARELIVPALRREADVIAEALEDVTSARSGIEIFLRTLIAHHLADLGTFRLIYVAAQFDNQTWKIAGRKDVTDPVHATTTKMYGALEAVLKKAPDFVDPSSARRVAVATHMAGIGVLSMLSLADAVRDPMAHSTEALIDALVLMATGGAIELPSRR